VLTVDYDQLGLRAGDRLLDLGCGFGRHAYEALRRGGHVVACDLSTTELVEVRGLMGAMAEVGEAPPDGLAACVTADATRLPYPDNAFDRIIASEVMEHIADDEGVLVELHRVLAPGGTLAVTVPAWLPERICWALSDQYHAPSVEGGHVRIYTEGELRRKLRGAGFRPGAVHLAHALHAPYWWLRCAVGPQNDAHPLIQPYKRLLEWDIVKAPPALRLVERLLNPVLGKSLVLYAEKPVEAAAPTEPAASSAPASAPAARPPQEVARAGA
jgi:SAM-dependent methyltransferase